MILHAPKVVERKGYTVTTTLCGRTNAKSRDGMNVALTNHGASCKLCRRILDQTAAPSAESGEVGCG